MELSMLLSPGGALAAVVLLGVILGLLCFAVVPAKGKSQGAQGSKKASKKQPQQQKKKEKGTRVAKAAEASQRQPADDSPESSPELEAVPTGSEGEEGQAVMEKVEKTKTAKSQQHFAKGGKKGGKDSKKAEKAGKKIPQEPEEPEEKEVKDKKVKDEVSYDGIEHGDEAAEGDWETATAVTKQQHRRQQRRQEEKAFQEAVEKEAKVAKTQRAIPGSMPAEEVKKEQQPNGIKAGPVLQLTPEQEKTAEAEGNMQVKSVKVPEKAIGRVIGPKGSMIKQLQEKTGVTRIDTNNGDGVLTLCGPPKAVALAEMAIDELVKKGYTSIAFENFSQAFVMVPPSFLPELIGKGGCVIRKIKEELGAEIELPEGTQNAKVPSKNSKVKVTIAGTADAVAKCKEVVDDLMKFGHHELTHPGYVHEEVQVESWQLNYIIGKKGSEIKHIQANFRVKVQIANEHSPCQATLIVGEGPNVERAKAYVEKLLWSSYETKGGRGATDKADDYWGDEEEDEDWMKDYLYKRAGR